MDCMVMAGGMVHHGSRCGMCKTGVVLTDERAGERFCQECGCVDADRIADAGAPSYENEGGFTAYMARNAATLRRHDMGLSTVIGKTDRDVSGKAIPPARVQSTKRLRQVDGWATISKNRNYIHAFIEMDKMGRRLNLGVPVMEKAAYLYRKAYGKNRKRQWKVLAFVAAVLYVACRETRTRRTLRDVEAASGTSPKLVAKYYKRVCFDLDIRPPIITPSACVARIVDTAGLSEKTRVRATGLLRFAEKTGIGFGKNPSVMAAAALYIVSLENGDEKTQADIAAAAEVSGMSLRTAMKSCRQIPGLSDGVGRRQEPDA